MSAGGGRGAGATAAALTVVLALTAALAAAVAAAPIIWANHSAEKGGEKAGGGCGGATFSVPAAPEEWADEPVVSAEEAGGADLDDEDDEDDPGAAALAEAVDASVSGTLLSTVISSSFCIACNSFSSACFSTRTCSWCTSTGMVKATGGGTDVFDWAGAAEAFGFAAATDGGT